MFTRPSSLHRSRRVRFTRDGFMGARRQRGVAAVLAAVFVGLVIVALGAIDVGNIYFARREMQRTADMAATAGVQLISSATGCAGASAAAQQNATANGLPTSGTVAVTCGRWDTTANAAPSFFSTTGTPQNAIQVTVTEPVPFSFFAVGPAWTAHATATAQSTDIRSFSLSTAVASLSGGMLNGLLNGLLGTNLNLSVGSYQGLATAQIKLQDLAVALGVGSMTQLLNTQVTVAKLTSAMVTALAQNTTVAASVATDLGKIAASIPGGQSIAIGNTSSTPGLLAVALGDPQAAATATVNVLDALLVAAEIAHGQSAVNLGTALNLGALANVTAQAKIIQPPVIAVGEALLNADGTGKTSAHSASVQIYLNVNLLNINVTVPYLGLPSLVGISALNLPIYIEVAPGDAYLQSTQCTAQKVTSQSTIVATTGVAALCIGGDASTNFGNTTVPTSCTLPTQLTTVNALGLSLINVSVSKLNLKVSASPTTLVFNGVQGDSDDYQSTNTNAIGSATAGLLTQLANAMSTQSGALTATVAGVDVTGLVAPLLGAVVSLLSPILSSLDGLLVPLLQLLGVQIGVSTVHDLGLACGQAQLVN